MIPCYLTEFICDYIRLESLSEMAYYQALDNQTSFRAEYLELYDWCQKNLPSQNQTIKAFEPEDYGERDDGDQKLLKREIRQAWRALKQELAKPAEEVNHFEAIHFEPILGEYCDNGIEGVLDMIDTSDTREVVLADLKARMDAAKPWMYKGFEPEFGQLKAELDFKRLREERGGEEE